MMMSICLNFRHMNKGKSVNDIVEIVKLPPHLRDHPYLQPFYGTVDWAVRAVFHHYVGWFSGRPEDLHTVDRLTKALKMTELVGGRVPLLQFAMNALQKREYQVVIMIVMIIVSSS